MLQRARFYQQAADKSWKWPRLAPPFTAFQRLLKDPSGTIRRITGARGFCGTIGPSGCKILAKQSSRRGIVQAERVVLGRFAATDSIVGTAQL